MEKLIQIKTVICGLCGMVGGYFVAAFGGWSEVMTTLVIMMAADYITGLMVAGIFKTSPKTDTGALESRAGWKGLVRKGGILLVVLVCHRFDMLMDIQWVQSTAAIGFIVNEAISLIENLGLMGLKMPAAVTRAIDLLQKKEEEGS